MANIGGINIIEYRQNQLPHCSSALHYLHQLLQTPSGRRVVFGEDNDRDFGPLYSLQKLGRNILSSTEIVVISEGVDSGLCQSDVEVVCEVLASIFASETKEDVVGRVGVGRRRR